MKTETTSFLLQNTLESVLAIYGEAQGREPFGRDHEIWLMFQTLERALTDLTAVRARPTLRCRWSVGHGSWAKIPWLVLLDGRESVTPDQGLHVALLFRQDMGGAYLALVEGAGKPKRLLGAADGMAFLRSRVQGLRRQLGELEQKGFTVGAEPDLRSDSTVAAELQAGVAAHRLYLRNEVPPDATIDHDLETLLGAYETYITTRPRTAERARRTWLLRTEPRRYDLAGAVRQLRRLTWPVDAHGDELRAGDRAFLWEAGDDPGVLATATLVGDPDEVPPDPEERPFVMDHGPESSLRVPLRIDRVLPSRLRKRELAAVPVLADHPGLGAARAGVLALTAPQGRAMAEAASGVSGPPFELSPAMGQLVASIAAAGFVFEPWQVAAYVTALRTKPFVILAGVSGTGKSRLPALVAERTGGGCALVPVRPDWTDSSEVLGYVDLQGSFRPGPLVEQARAASEESKRHHVCVVDEMNLARVEHYFAEVLSRIEDRAPHKDGGFHSSPLLGVRLSASDRGWAEVRLPPNLGLVGTVNMDESAHGFSRKVLDRAFTLEFSDVDLASWDREVADHPEPVTWPARAWYPRAQRLGDLDSISQEERTSIDRVVEALTEVNRFLAPAQLQLGYRSRDEIALFLIHAAEAHAWFVTRDGEPVDPLDLALMMKVLPRVVGGSNPIRRAVLQLLGWAVNRTPFKNEDQPQALLDSWDRQGRPGALREARFPRTAARLALMWDRLLNEGFTSFWL